MTYKEWQKAFVNGDKSGLTNAENGSIISSERERKFIDDLRNGKVNISVDWENQNKHTISPEWKNNARQQIKKLKNGEFRAQSPKSRLYGEIDPEELIKKYCGTGMLAFNNNSDIVDEFVSADYPIGITFDRKVGKYVKTKRLQIRYQKSGVHIFPVLEREGNK